MLSDAACRVPWYSELAAFGLTVLPVRYTLPESRLFPPGLAAECSRCFCLRWGADWAKRL